MPRPIDAPVIAPADGLRQRQRADGTWRVWWEPTALQRKAGAQPVDLSALRPGDAQRRATALVAQWAKGATPKPRGYSVSALILDYTQSRWFTDRATSTQASYRTDMRAIEDKWGAQAVAAIDAPTMVLWYESLLKAKGPTRARALLTMLSILMVHAERRGWIAKGSNPCRDIGMAKPAPRDRVATGAEAAALLAAADTTDAMLALALRLVMVTGQRATDIRMARPGDFERTALPIPGAPQPVPAYVWRLVRSKRGNAGVIPILDPATVAMLDAQIAAALDGPGTLIWNGAGETFTRDRFQKRFAALRATAAATCPSVTSLEWRDLRRTLGVTLRAAGVARDDVGDLLGNTLATSAQLAAVYTPATQATALRAVAAITSLTERKKA